MKIGKLPEEEFRIMIVKMNPGGSDGKVSAYNAGDLGSIPGLGRSPGEGNGNPLQYSCLENPMDQRAWWAAVHEFTKSQTQLSDFTSLHFKMNPGSQENNVEVARNVYQRPRQTKEQAN